MPQKSKSLSQFWKELKRRRVVRVIIFYTSASFVILELISNISEPFGLPDWTFKLVFVLLVIGFIITIILSWTFDITPDGIQRTTATGIDQEEEQASQIPVMNSKYAGSIAVLPFQDMSPEKDQEYFCDGISEEIINALTQVESLKVIARTSAFAFKGQQIDIREIGSRLQVESVLEGSIRKDREKLRITAQLINVSDGSHLWSATFDRSLKDIFTIQEEISLAIVRNLKVKLTGKEKGGILKRYTEDTEAYQYYLKGLYYWQMMTPEGNMKAQENYMKAFEKDPQFALVYAILGSNFQFAATVGFIPPKLAEEKSMEYTLKAIEIDNTISVAHATLGGIKLLFNWDIEGAEEGFLHSIRLNPNGGWDHFLYSLYLKSTCRFEESIAEAQIALEMDPFNIYISTQLGASYMLAGKVDKAIERHELAISLYPQGYMAYQHLGEALQLTSNPDKAVEAFEKAVQLSGGNTMAVSRLACAYLEAGNTAAGEKQIESLKQRMKSEYVPASVFIPYYTSRDDNDQAFKWLEKACNEKDVFLLMYMIPYQKLYPFPDDPRFTSLLERVGLNKFQH